MPSAEQDHHQMPHSPNHELLLAVEGGNLAAAKAAIRAGADEHITGDALLYKNNVMTAAAESGNEELVEFLLTVGAEAQPSDTGPIEIAVARGRVRMVKAFLKHWKFGVLPVRVQRGRDSW